MEALPEEHKTTSTHCMYTDKGALVSEAMLRAHISYLDGLTPDFLSYEEYNLFKPLF